MDDMGDDHKCNICNKLYSSYKTLWKHNKNKHKPNVNISNSLVSDKYDNSQLKINKIYKCKYCDNEYNHKQSRWSHEKKCQIIFEEKEKQNNELNIAKIELEKYNLDKEHEIKLAEIELEKINANKEIKLAEINKEIELKKLEIIASSEAYIRPLGL